MTDPTWQDDEGISLFGLGAVLLRNWRRIALLAFLGGALAAASVFNMQREWVATASFIPQGGESRSSGLSSLAGQFGFSLPTTNPTASLDFYMNLLRSPAFLRRVVHDTMAVQERGNARVPFLDLFNVEGDTPKLREERGVETLRGMVTPSVSRTTGIVTVAVQTAYPSVSLQIVNRLVTGVNEFNLQTSRTQASAERRFLETRMNTASTELREAEDRMQGFLRTNREYMGSPQLSFQHDRLRRELMLRQDVYTRLAALYEEARAREIRDTPAITIYEPPYVPTQSAPRGRVKKAALGIIVGGMIGVALALISWFLARRRQKGDQEYGEFVSALAQVRGQLLGRVPGWRGGSRG